MKRKAVGMTLMELLVSLAILSIMLATATMILTSVRRVVRQGQENVRTMADMRAIQHRFRADLACLTNTGLLAIVAQPDGNSRLIFTGTGRFQNLAPRPTPAQANAATLDFGVTQDARAVLWRRGWLHTRDGVVDGDCLGWPLVGWRNPVFPRSTIAQRLLDLPGEPALNLPVKTLPDAIAAWPYFAEGISTFRVQWTAGKNGNGALIWFDEQLPQNLNWPDVFPAEQDTAKNHWPECNLGEPGKPPVYCALWTFKNKVAWPKAIRILLQFAGSTDQHEIVLKPPAL